jgi:hypothetical protein
MKQEENSQEKIIDKFFNKIISMGTKKIKNNKHE